MGKKKIVSPRARREFQIKMARQNFTLRTRRAIPLAAGQARRHIISDVIFRCAMEELIRSYISYFDPAKRLAILKSVVSVIKRHQKAARSISRIEVAAATLLKLLTNKQYNLFAGESDFNSAIGVIDHCIDLFLDNSNSASVVEEWSGRPFSEFFRSAVCRGRAESVIAILDRIDEIYGQKTLSINNYYSLLLDVSYQLKFDIGGNVAPNESIRALLEHNFYSRFRIASDYVEILELANEFLFFPRPPQHVEISRVALITAPRAPVSLAPASF